MVHVGEADFIRDLYLLMAPLTHIGGETQSENVAAIKGNITEIKELMDMGFCAMYNELLLYYS